MRPNTDIDFWKKVQKGDNCWVWLGTKAGNGYGTFKMHQHQIAAHRLAYELTYGTIPDGFLVCHRCDNPVCVNPDHLFLGTQADNLQDMVEKGRGRGHSADQLGEANINAKLTRIQVEDIRRCYAAGMTTFKQSAQRYGVTETTIRAIINRHTWK